MLWLVIPIIGSLAAARWYTPAAFQPKYLIVALPALVTLVAIGLSNFPPVILPYTCVGVMALAALPLLTYYRSDFKEEGDWKRAIEYVVTNRESGDGIIFLSHYGRLPFEYYYAAKLEGTDRVAPIYPAAAWGQYLPVLTDRELEPTAEAARRLEAFSRVWVVLLWDGLASVHEDATPLRLVLNSEYREALTSSLGADLRLSLYERTSAGGATDESPNPRTIAFTLPKK